MSQDTPFLMMRGISKKYRGTQALDSVDFSAMTGEVHAIAGENGAGKSTLIKVLSGAVRPDEGQILLDGRVVELSTPLHAHRHGIFTVYQEFSLARHLSVAENILMGQMPTVRGMIDWSTANQEARRILEQIGFGHLDVRQRVARLSVSQQQMVEIAKALAGKLRILILDEPSAVLSQEELDRLFALINQLKGQGVLILYISHRLGELFQIADRITVLKDGKLVDTARAAELNQDQLIRLMVGRTFDKIYPQRTPPIGEVLLRLDRVSRQGAFSDISLSIRRGEIVGLFGLVGSGRTELARCIFGVDALTGGAMTFKDKPYQPRTPRQAVDAGVAFLTEDRKLNGLVMTCSLADNIGLASLRRVTRWGILDRREQRQRVRAKVDELAIRPPQLDRLVWQLSGGNQQKVMLAKWLLTEAQLLILDEPTRGVDIKTKIEIYQMIDTLAQQGTGILLISSEMLEILGMSDRILVMREGRLMGEVSKAEASEERLLSLATGVRRGEGEGKHAASVGN